MYLMSRYAGWGRGFWVSVDNGTLDVRTRNEAVHISVRHGRISQQITRRKGECTTLRYGRECTTKKAGKIIKQELFEQGSLRAIRKGCLYKKKTGVPLCGSKGTVDYFSTSGGARGREVFKYDNGVQAYTASIWRKKLLLRRPDGKLWAELHGKVSLTRASIAESLDTKKADLGASIIIRGDNWGVTIYDVDGVNVVTQGRLENRQKQGKWLEVGKTVYYLSGVPVSRSLCEENPEKWNAYEILKIPNAQLRCSLLSKMGYDKLIEKVKCRVIDNSKDGGQLLEIDTLTDNGHRGLDRIMKMVRVICPSTGQSYVLRVPPVVSSYDNARQWTFGLREESLAKGAHLELAEET